MSLDFTTGNARAAFYVTSCPKSGLAMPKSAKTPKHRHSALPSKANPPTLQVAALCYRRSPKGLRILLITSRETARWIVPKGWPMRNRSEAQAAAREAYEEAGLRGAISEESIGYYTYLKRMRSGAILPCMVRLYPLEVHEMLRKYPETGQRRVKWFSQAKAARKIKEPELAAWIRDFDPDGPAAEVE